MIYFAQAQYLFLIFLIPVIFIGYAIARRIRRKRIARFGDPALVENLTPTASRRKGWVKLIFISLALLFFSIGMARPQLGAILKEKEIKGAEIMIVLDVSNSMLAEDYSPNRLERAKLAISKLVDELQGDRIGLIIFAGQSFVQLPITSDYVSAKIFLNSITNESVPVQGTALGEAIHTALRSFTSESENSRAVILITDGENHEDDPVSAAKDALSVGARVFCVGVGSFEGKPIPMNGELLKDQDGNIVVTKLDEATLREVAKAGDGIYVRAANAEFGLNPIIDEIRAMEAQKYQSVVFEEYDEQYMYFFAIALFFLLVEFLISTTRNNRRLFGSSLKYLIVPVLLLSSVSGFAQDDKSEVRSGNRAFKKGNYDKALVEFQRGLLKDSTSVNGNFNTANTLYRMENFTDAQTFMDAVAVDSLKLHSPRKAADYFYNKGNLSLKQKNYQQAVDDYKESLRISPENIDAKSNLAYAQKMLQNQQQQQQQNQDQQNQDQNQDQDQDQQNDQQDSENDDQKQDQKQDQNKDQNQDKNKDQNKDKPNQQPKDSESQPKITPQTANQMLQAIEDKEKETQEKVKKAKALEQQKKKKEKNW
ncbi:MAG: VWA domain-containing protein [Bacteroidales bacterium]|nr:VWA domain-containing protein [Bacteroidales bacterium]